MKMFKLNQLGLSLPEVMIGLGITAAIGLGGAKLLGDMEKSKVGFSAKMNSMSVAKLVEAQLQSPAGCNNLIGKRVGDSLAVKSGGHVYQTGTFVGDAKIENLQFSNFIPTDELGQAGIADIVITIKDKKINSKSITNTFILPVNMASGAVTSCNLMKLSMMNDLEDKLCAGAYGTFSSGLTCSQVVAKLEKETLLSICQDLYGSGTPVLNGGINCDLTAVHFGKTCPSNQYLSGFDSEGQIICVPGGSSGTSTGGTSTGGTSTGGTSTGGTSTGGTSTGGTSTGGSTTGGSTTGGSTTGGSTTGGTTTGGTTTGGTTTGGTTTGGTTTGGTTTGGTTTGNTPPSSPPAPNWSLTCFVGGTKIALENGKTKKIENVKVGDVVQTYDEVSGTMTYSPVKEVLHHKEDIATLLTFTLSNGTKVTSNDVHLIFIKELNNYISASKIHKNWLAKKAMTLIGQNNESVSIVNIKRTVKRTKLYNLHVKGIFDGEKVESQFGHNYFANGVLVHNEKDYSYNECISAGDPKCTCCKRAIGGNGAAQCKGSEADKEAYDACYVSRMASCNPAVGLKEGEYPFQSWVACTGPNVPNEGN